MGKEINLSVHGLVDFLLRRGSIDNRVYNNASMAEGSRIHLRYQKIQDGSYLSEQYLETNYDIDEFTFKISGRADGIILSNPPIIDEIKSTVIDLEDFFAEQKDWHLGQAKVYAYMYAKTNSLDEMNVRLTYISQKDEDKIIKNFNYSFNELDEFLHDLLVRYLDFYKEIDKHNQLKIESSEKLVFPFENFRKGQRDLSKYVYGTIVNNDTLFIEAPTGIGKTISTLFPACKTFANNQTEKIFYLSAKAIAKDVAYNACEKMQEKGLVARTIKLTSKEKMCQTGKKKCNPDDCPFAKGYYDKIQEVLRQIAKKEELIDESVINHYAYENDICAFELQLDASLLCDIIICDYNYFFDPLVYLKRYFETEYVPFVALIDETHNLVERSRDMYSADFELHKLELLQKQFKAFKHPKIKRAMKKIINYMDTMALEEEDFINCDPNFSDEFYSYLNAFFKQSQDVLKNYPDYVTDLFLEVFRMTNRFLKICEFIGDGFKVYYEKLRDNLIARIKCVDSSTLIKKTLKKIKASVFFSATLTPMDYYVKCLGGNDDTPIINLESPFPKDNLLTIVRNDISTRYKDREFSYEEIARTIESVVNGKLGNYLVFFSSYIYLERVYEHLYKCEKIEYILQTRDMEEKDKKSFLSHFLNNPTKTTVGLAVLGGAFSEGIDLVSDKLIGAVIVGVGLPTVSYERDLIKNYFDSKEMNGYDYSYVNPGINKILQAAGRVIRSETDTGVVLFIDDRYSQRKYRDVINKEYRNAHYVFNRELLEKQIEDFWKNH